MITINYYYIIIITTLIYTVLVHLFNWWGRSIDEMSDDSERYISTWVLIISHIAAVVFLIYIMLYPII